jgi:molybdopterin molybdotransferase
MIAVERALEIVLQHAPQLAHEDVGLGVALGRVLASDVRSDVDQPPFDRAAMDGYAVRSYDLRDAPVTLDVVGRIPAGAAPHASGPQPRQVMEIMTGAPVPPGADAVLQIENTRSVDGGQRVELLESVVPGRNIAPRASEVRAGNVVLARGRTLDPAALAVLAAAGCARVSVGRRPRVFVLATGDELVEVSEVPGPGQIRSSNGYALGAQARLAGADVVSLGTVADDQQMLEERLTEGLRADVLLVSGGVSKGAFDLVEPALARLGVRVLFDAVTIKPGAPLVFGTAGATLVFGLPGNPISTQVTFDLFVRPALLRMQGAQTLARPRVEAELLSAVDNRSKRANHLPAALRFEGGRFVARPIRSQGSADMTAHAQANALLVLQPEQVRAEAGARVPAILLGNFLDTDGR